MLTYSTWHLSRSHFAAFAIDLRSLTFFVSTDAYRGDVAEGLDLVTYARLVFKFVTSNER